MKTRVLVEIEIDGAFPMHQAIRVLHAFAPGAQCHYVLQQIVDRDYVVEAGVVKVVRVLDREELWERRDNEEEVSP